MGILPLVSELAPQYGIGPMKAMGPNRENVDGVTRMACGGIELRIAWVG